MDIKRDSIVRLALLESLRLLHLPYQWGGDNPAVDWGLDCSGFLGYILRYCGVMPGNYDDTAQGYYNRFKGKVVEKPFEGCGAFYGRSMDNVSHCMLIVNERACIGAVRGNSTCVSPEIAGDRRARIDVMPINYRKDLIEIVDLFSEE